MNRLIKLLADEETYFPLFLVSLCFYALIGVILFGVTADYMPRMAGGVATTFLIGAVGMGFAGRFIHNYCHNKLNDLESKLLEGINSPETEMTSTEWNSIRQEAKDKKNDSEDSV